jgi:hypothetical protein
MQATMHVPSSVNPPEQSAAQRWGLLAAAVAAALLGLTTLDVAGPAAKKPRVAQAERTAECIVASAVFVGVVPAP